MSLMAIPHDIIDEIIEAVGDDKAPLRNCALVSFSPVADAVGVRFLSEVLTAARDTVTDSFLKIRFSGSLLEVSQSTATASKVST
jgi:hypothetical protein